MRTKMTIHSIDIRKSKAGDHAIQITAKSDDGKYAKGWIGEKAPDAIFDIWTSALGTNPMESVKGGNAWSILGVEFKAKIVDSDYGLKMEDVCHLDTPEPKTETNPETDFSDLPTESKKEIEADDLPF